MSEHIIQTDKYDYAIFLPYLKEEIVRCMDCKNFANDSEHGAWCNWFMRSLHDDYDGFCWRGERRSE